MALLTCLLTAIAPISILFSQELRFYSAMQFFYFLTAWLMVNTIQTPTWKNFLLFSLITTISIYFHIYVSLALCGGIPYSIVFRKNENFETTAKRILLSLIATGLLVLPGYHYFCRSEAAYQFGLDLPLIPFHIMQGIGLLFPSPSIGVGILCHFGKYVCYWMLYCIQKKTCSPDRIDNQFPRPGAGDHYCRCDHRLLFRSTTGLLSIAPHFPFCCTGNP